MADQFQTEVIVSIKTDSSGAQEGLDNLKKSIGEVGNTSIDKPFKTLKQEIKEATIEAQKMASQFGANSKEFASAAQKVATLKDEFQEVNQAVSAFNPDNKLQALVGVAKGATGALQGVSGAMAFVGVESESASQTMAKLQGLMAFSDALNSVDDIKNSFKNFGTVIQSTSAFQKANAVATTLTSGAMRLLGISASTTGFAFKALKTAIAATGIGLLVVAIGTLLPIISNWISGTDDAEAAQKRLSGAVESLNHNLDTNLSAIEKATERQIKYAKIAGQSQEQLNEISRQGLVNRREELALAVKQADAIADQAAKTKGIDNDKYKELLKNSQDTYKKYLDSASAIDDYDLDRKVEKAENERKLAKDTGDKEKASYDKRASERKAAAERQAQETKAALDEIKKINEDAQKSISESTLSANGKELAQLEYEFEIKKAKFKKYGKDVSIITQEYNINRAAIEKKYRDEINAFILSESGNEYEIQKAEIQKKYDEQIKNATDFGQKLALVALETKKLLELEEEKTNKENLDKANTVTIEAETKLVNTKVDNRVLETDDTETRKAKLEALNAVEIEVENSQFAAKLLSLKGNQSEIELATAEHNAKLKDMEYELAEDRKGIDEAAKEAKLNNLSAISGALNKASDLFEQGSVANKAISVASATIDTYTGASKALAAYPPPFNFIAAAGVVVAGLANVKKIISTKVGKKDNTSASASAPVTTAPTINSTVLANNSQIQDVRVINQQDQVIKTYISQRDLQSAEDKKAFLDKMSSF